MRFLLLVGLLATVALAGCIDDVDAAENDQGSSFQDVNQDGHVVVAVIDSGSNPYHWDFLADHMPQHLDDSAANDVPLGQDPGTWLSGHPGADGFARYERLDLTLTPDDGNAVPAQLYQGDEAQWAKVGASRLDSIQYSWIPDTKVVGWVTFGGNGWAASSHGVGTSSVSVGNIHGSCPECLLVFVNGLGEDANRWVESQDWIDVQTNSWGYSAGVAVRDRFYAGSDVLSQKDAVERGQAIFFSAGNGLANTFTAPNPTLFSSQEGPDWIVTVGAISPADGSSYTGHGKPADVASVGSGYPSAGGATVTANSTFGGTSNATPVTAGIYAKALYELRKMGSRTQEANVVSVGGSCGEVNPDCALADGVLTYAELRDAVLEAATHTSTGYSLGLVGGELPATNNIQELTYMAEGHGSYYGKLHSDEEWQAEIQLIVDTVQGKVVSEEDAMLDAWSAALSACTQDLWGTWDLGHDQLGVPAADPNWPVRTWFTELCPVVGPTIIDVNGVVTGAHPLY